MRIPFKSAGAALAIALLLPAPAAFAQQKFITIGTGGVTGVYYAAGGAICRLVNKDRKSHGIRCSVESTGGSVYNINTIRAGELDMGVAQSDWQYHAWKGDSVFKDQGPFKELRAVFSLHPEPFTVVARVDADVKEFTDLKGKRVNVGNPGSGQRATMEVVMDALGWTMDDFAGTMELKSSEQALALCAGEIDAIVFTVGHPSLSIEEAASSCDTVLVPVAGAGIDTLVAGSTYYTMAVIPGGLYAGNPDDVQTFGVRATLVSSAEVPDDVIYVVVSSVFEHFDDFVRLHPAFATLTKEAMVQDGLSAPMHRGALRYFEEAGLR